MSYDTKSVIKSLEKISEMIIALRGSCDADADQEVLPFFCSSSTAILFADGSAILIEAWTHPG